jgi:hypothetical protein
MCDLVDKVSRIATPSINKIIKNLIKDFHFLYVGWEITIFPQ